MSEKYQLIRGQRIIQLLEATYGELERNTMAFIPTTKKRQHVMHQTNVQGMQMVAAPPSNALQITGEVKSGNNTYESTMFFTDVQYEDEDTQQNITFTAADGEDYHIMPISLNRHNVKVRCTCLDFRWRFSIYNQKTDSLYGDGPELYQKKTNRPPNNPRNVPGLCKHLLKLGVELKNSGVVVL